MPFIIGCIVGFLVACWGYQRGKREYERHLAQMKKDYEYDVRQFQKHLHEVGWHWNRKKGKYTIEPEKKEPH